MNRQSLRLQQLMAERRLRVVAAEELQTPATEASAVPAQHCHSIVVSGAAGGVGRSTIALRLALDLAAAGHRVCLLDANAGISHTAILAGLSNWPLAADATSARPLSEALVELNTNLAGLFGASDIAAGLTTDAIAAQADDLLGRFDYCVADVGVRTTPAAAAMLAEADVAMMVTTPMPIALAETYAALKTLAGDGPQQTAVVVNRTATPQAAAETIGRLTKTAEAFLGRRPSTIAAIEEDASVFASGLSRDVSQIDADGPFAVAVRGLATRLSRRLASERRAA